MPIRKIPVNNLPKGKTFIIPIKRIKTVFSDSNKIGLFMTNDKYSFVMTICMCYSLRKGVTKNFI